MSMSPLKPISHTAADAEAMQAESQIKFAALGVLIANSGGQIAFNADELAQVMNDYAGIKVEPVRSQYIGEAKIVIMSLIPKLMEKESLIIQ